MQTVLCISTLVVLFLQMNDDPVSAKDALQSGRNIVAAGYAVYGSATMVVLTVGAGVNSFMLDPVSLSTILYQSLKI